MPAGGSRARDDRWIPATDRPLQSISTPARLAFAAVGGGWVGLAVFLGASGRLAFSPDIPVPLIGVLFAVPLLTVGVLALFSEKVRHILLGIPLQLLIGLNAMRIVGVIFLLDAAAGSLAGPFPFFAGLGDMITGALAISLVVRIARSREPSARLIGGWNAFGVLDLLVAVGLGITSAPGSPLQLIHAGAGSSAVQFLPLCLVPAVLVPFNLLTHAIIAAQLRVRSSAVHSTLPAGAVHDAGEIRVRSSPDARHTLEQDCSAGRLADRTRAADIATARPFAPRIAPR